MWNGFEHMIPPLKSFNGMYMAEVVDDSFLTSDAPPVDDGSGRVKTRVFPMMTGLDETVLPWAVPAFGLFEGGSVGAGAFTIPAVGSKVWVFFAAGDVRSPVYFAAALGKSDGPVGAEPGIKIWRTRSGHTITINDKSGEEVMSVEHKDGEKIVLTNNAVQLGKGTLRKLMDERAAATFKAHTHTYDAGVSPYVAPGSTSGTPSNDMDSDMTTDTKAS